MIKRDLLMENMGIWEYGNVLSGSRLLSTSNLRLIFILLNFLDFGLFHFLPSDF
jgi:hypothetical protein